MSAPTSTRLELCRIVREHCYQIVELPAYPAVDEPLRTTCAAALEVSIETMAGWFMMDETVLANIRLAMTMVGETMGVELVH